MTNEQIREGGYMEDIVRATEHDMYIPDIDGEKVYKTVEAGVVNTYEKIEDGVVGGYKKVENSFVSGYKKIEDKFVQKFLAQKGETTEDAKERLSRK